MGPFYRVVFCGFLRVLHGPLMRVGSCRFYGPAVFLPQCRAALEKLQGLDREAYMQLTTRSQLTFYFNMEEIMDDRFNGIYSIPKAHLEWGVRGIIVRFIYAVFLQEMLGRSFPSTPEQLCLKHDAIRIRTQEWLKRHHFPTELTEPFDASAMDG